MRVTFRSAKFGRYEIRVDGEVVGAISPCVKMFHSHNGWSYAIDYLDDRAVSIVDSVHEAKTAAKREILAIRERRGSK